MSLEPLTPQQEDAVLEEIGYNRRQLKADIVALRKLVEEQEHLPTSRLKENEAFLSNFLVGCKGSVETAKRKLDLYYTLRGKGEVFSHRDETDYLETTRNFAAVIQLPRNDSDGSRIYVARLLNANIDQFSPLDYMKTGLLLMEHRLRRDGILNWETYIIDCADLTMSHFVKISLTWIRAFLSFFLDAYPLRVKKIVIANAPSILASAINNVFLPFLSDKLKERYMISKESPEKLVNFVELLPSDYNGGKEARLSVLADEWASALQRMAKEWGQHLQQEVDESRRPTLPGSGNPYFGLHGSIKSLVVD